MELAIVIDYGQNFVKETYDLEEDKPLIFHYFEIIDTLCIAIKSLDSRSHNAEAVANKLSSRSVTYKKSLIEYARACMQPDIVYFNLLMIFSFFILAIINNLKAELPMYVYCKSSLCFF